MSHDDEPHEEHEEHVNHEAWVIPYADLLTLLMAMFIALFAMSSVDQAKFKKVALGFNEALGGPKLTTGVFAGSPSQSVTGGNGAGGSSDSSPGTGTGGGSVGPSNSNPGKDLFARIAQQQTQFDAAKSRERETLRDVERKITNSAQKLGLDKKLQFDLQERGLVVRVVTDRLLFNSGDATLQAQGQDVLRLVGDVLKTVDNPLLIEGHTDNVPIAGGIYKSNWGLSTARAESVLLYLTESLGLDVSRMRPTGWADTHPIASNATEEGRAANRRVEIIVESKVIDDILQANNLTNKSVSDKTGTPSKPGLDEIVKPGELKG